MEVIFCLKDSQTQWGERVCLAGNLPELGTWHAEKALLFNTDESTYPMWQIIDSVKLQTAEQARDI